MQHQRGFGLADLLVALALLALLVLVGVGFAVPRLSREELRSAAYTVQSQLQLARVEAVSRNRACRFVLDRSARHVWIVDFNDPSDTTDDLVLREAALPADVQFVRPDGGDAVTLGALSADVFQATFGADGSVISGAGEVCMSADGHFDRVLLRAAGGVRTEVWTGGAWRAGS